MSNERHLTARQSVPPIRLKVEHACASGPPTSQHWFTSDAELAVDVEHLV